VSSEKKLSLPAEINLPHHIAIIPDGNRRWAHEHNLPPLEGHRRGAQVVIPLLRAARQWGIHTMTFWAFSTENWHRSSVEVKMLMALFEDSIDRHLAEAKKEGVRIYHLGRRDRLPQSLRKKIMQAEEETRQNTKHILNIALDYGGHDEILRAIGRFLDDLARGKIRAEDLDEVIGEYEGKYPYYRFKNYLDTRDQPYPYPDLVIRTSGELRTSGFLPWQSVYAEFYWEKVHFPDFTPEKLRAAIIDFSQRQRRFGGKKLNYAAASEN